MRHLGIVLLLIVLFGGRAVCTSSEIQGEKFVQDRFLISFWVDPPADDQMEERYREIAEANFTAVLGGFGANTPEQVERQLDLCQKHGLKALVSLPGYRAGAVQGAGAIDAVKEADQFPDHPACWGYMTKDEPHSSLFPNLKFMVDHLHETRPGKLTYINLFPNIASAQQLGAENYDQHVARFVNEVQPDVLCMDHYPFMESARDSREGYCQNLAVMQKYALERRIPFWNFFNTMPFGSHEDPTESQLRWQIFTSLAYGAKGVLYFCYWTPGGGEFPKGGAIIRRDGTKTRHYAQAKRINAALKNLGPALMELTCQGTYRVKPEDDPTRILHDTPIKAISKGDYLVGVFKHSDGRHAVLLSNYEYAHTAWPTVEFHAQQCDVKEVCQETGKETSLLDESPSMAGLQLSLDSGAGRLFLLP